VLGVDMGGDIGNGGIGRYGDGERVERRKGADEDGCRGHCGDV